MIKLAMTAMHLITWTGQPEGEQKPKPLYFGVKML